jgi:hypothetical protein
MYNRHHPFKAHKFLWPQPECRSYSSCRKCGSRQPYTKCG